jgi:sorbitol-6-phosphate 2-dehydrogenase
MGWLGLEGKVVIVTGGSSGIGRACCRGFAGVGARVVVADVNEKDGRLLVDELTSSFGGTHLFVRVDVSNGKDVRRMVESAVSGFGRLDVLVNNAGINMPRLLIDPQGKEELTEEIWDKMVSINQKGTFLCAQAAARQMIASKEGGVIVNVASESGMEGSEGQSCYAGTKAALYTLTRSWAKELGKHNVRVVGIAPGILEPTPLRSDEYERALAYTRSITVEQLRAGYEKVSIPLGRTGTLEEIANTICFLSSSRASYIHGTTVNVSGGKTRV